MKTFHSIEWRRKIAWKGVCRPRRYPNNEYLAVVTASLQNLADRRSLYVPRTLFVGQGKTNARDVHVSAICGVQGNKQLPPGVQTMNCECAWRQFNKPLLWDYAATISILKDCKRIIQSTRSIWSREDFAVSCKDQDYLGAREGNGCTKSERCATLSQPRPSLRTTLLNRHQFPVLNLEIHSFADQDMLLLFVAHKSQFSSLQLDRNYVDRVKHDTARNRGCCGDYDPTYLTYHVFLSSFPAPWPLSFSTSLLASSGHISDLAIRYTHVVDDR